MELYLTGMYGRGDSTADFRHRAAQQLSLRLKHFTDKEGAPSQVRHCHHQYSPVCKGRNILLYCP